MISPEVRYLESTASTSFAEESGIGSLPSLGSYRVSDDDMATGSTLGAPRVACVIKATGAIEKVFSVDAGATLLGTVVLQHWETASGARIQPIPGTFGIHPDFQDHKYVLSNGVDVTETIFALNRAPDGETVDPPLVYLWIAYRNTLDKPVEIDTYAFCALAGETKADLEARYDASLRGIVACNRARRPHVRFIGTSLVPESWETTHDHAKAVSDRSPGRLANDASASGNPLAVLRLQHRLEPEKLTQFWFLLAVGADGADALLADVRDAPDAPDALDGTRRHFHAVLRRSEVMTPNADVNRGVMWAKANMLRVELRPKSGWAFTNDPTRSTKAIGRDTSFFALGSDYVTPSFTRESLLGFVERQEKSGMIVEWYDMLSGKTADYGLNVNDNTPLLILALAHHAACSGDPDFLRRVYPAAKRAAEYLLRQRDHRGLIWCTTTATGSEGIVGWRNIIPNYRISGASTEVNSETYGALCALGKMARAADHADDARRFEAEANALRDAINTHLANPDNGLYLLAIDVDGTRRTEVSSDLVFPVVYKVADETTAERVVRRLSADDFWTDAGIRTVPHNAPQYSPDHGSGLLGGVWVGVSFWYALCASHFLPAKMEEALATTFENYSRDPRRSNTVPGQFSEWLDGETLVNRGMMLSPWFPPRYVWAAVEGAAGFTPDFEGPALNPQIPLDWRWIAVRNVPFAGRTLTWCVIRDDEGLHGFANCDFVAGIPMARFEEDISETLELSGDDVSAIALRDGEKILVFTGSSSLHTVTTRLCVHGARSSRVRAFQGLRRRWTEEERIDPDLLERGYIVSIGPRAFQLLEFRP